MYLRKSLPGFLVLFLAPLAHAFNPPTDTQGALKVSIAEPGDVMALEKPVAVPVTLQNSGAAPLDGTLKLWVTDDWRIGAGGREARLPFSLKGNETQTVPVSIIAGKSTYAALYPFHAQAESGALKPHAILILSVTPQAVQNAAPPKVWPTLTLNRTLRLDAPGTYQARFNVKGGEWQNLPMGWQGSEASTGATVALQDMDRGGRRRALGVHPSWKTGWGEVALDYKIAVPQTKPIALDFATAIRDSGPTEPQSDGVQFDVWADDGEGFKKIFERFSAAKKWEEARVDLSAYAGKTITLRLFTGPGQENNTSCDQAYWAAPRLIAGDWNAKAPTVPQARQKAAVEMAFEELAKGEGIAIPIQLNEKRPFTVDKFAWKLSTTEDRFGVAVICGTNGLEDSAIAMRSFNTPDSLSASGFDIEIDGRPYYEIKSGNVTSSVLNGVFVVDHPFSVNEVSGIARATIFQEKGALRVAFSMPGVKRDAKGSPRFTKLALGPCSETARRVYAGFGNVLENPKTFDIGAGGFHLSTRHVGADYANGLSLVQATDIYPDSFSVNADTKTYSLVAHHDATFSFIPSSKGAFAAARVYRQIANFKAAGGVSKLQGKMCLDQWGGDYKKAAQDIELAAKYGLTDAIFVKHVWQRWGYDYRLPDIYPPAGNNDDFMAMVAACKKAGILFAPHDNYIDFYPDADGFSYDHILFNADGTPQKAWFNEGRNALSYRWAPHAFQPFLERNLKLMKNGFAPDGLFIDVFTAIAPIDFYDRAGRFYPKTVTQQKWGEAFSRAREIFGNNAPQLSEAGTDALIGQLDGAQSDHAGWVPANAPRPSGNDGYFRWTYPADDGERTPWHDMATHGDFVLLAGGLGNRYASGGDGFLHGYGSDDYLSNTVLGGRNPMCDGPFNRRAVMTYWLLHDLCAKLAKSEMLSHQFGGDDIHRQTVTFEGATVHVNRGTTSWQMGGASLPQYGFTAKAGDREADIALRDGVISGFARSPGVLFADARPPSADGGSVRPRVLGVTNEGRKLRVRVAWDVLSPVEPSYRPFLHFVNEKASGGENIAFQGGANFDAQALTKTGTFETVYETTLPDTVTTNEEFALRFGMYDPQSGARLGLAGPNQNGRALGGGIKVTFADGQPAIAFTPQPPDPQSAQREARLNVQGKVINFGPVSTNGAFQLKHLGDEWQLTPLPGSKPFEVAIQLDALRDTRATSNKVRSITAIDLNGAPVGDVKFEQTGARLRFKTTGAFAYKLRF